MEESCIVEYFDFVRAKLSRVKICGNPLRYEPAIMINEVNCKNRTTIHTPISSIESGNKGRCFLMKYIWLFNCFKNLPMRKRKIVYSGILFLALLFSGFFLYAGNASRHKLCLPKTGTSPVSNFDNGGFTFFPTVILFN